MTAEIMIGTPERRVSRREAVKVITGASVGTVLEWYDFFLYGSLAVFFSAHFFPSGSATAGYLATLATFGVGFVIRPLGAVIFGRFGDKAGRKATFLATIIAMGVSTAGIGLLPGFETLGWASTILLIALRLLQGLAMGGEYGGAATYIAEHTEPGRRGYSTSWLQTTATVGFLLSLAVVLACRATIGADDFAAWGWRIPFLSSVLILIISVYIRATLSESPVFTRMKRENRASTSPLRDTFADRANVKKMLVVLFGAQAAVAVVWYTCNFYTLYFLTSTLKLPTMLTYGYMGAALLFSLPLYIFFGWLSDRIGRKWIVLAGCALAVATLQPIFQQLTVAVNPRLAEFQRTVKVELVSGACSRALFAAPVSDCDKARDFLTQAGISYGLTPAKSAQEPLDIRIGENRVSGFDRAALQDALDRAGYPRAADPEAVDRPMLFGLLALLMIWGAMAYAPMSAYYVELFPAKVRYTSVSVPYNVGAAYFGGLAPFMSTAFAVQSGNIYNGLWYTIIVGGASVLFGAVFLKESRGNDLSQ